MTAKRSVDVGWLLDALRREYGAMPWRPHGDAVSELVLTILSQHTNDNLSGQAFAALLERFPGWDAIAAAPTDAIVEAIRVGGLAAQKAPRIQRVLRELVARTGGYDLAFLRALELAEARAWLTSLDGVGPKTASCVLLFALGVPAIPVDTHVFRVAGRLGLIPAGVNADRAHALLESLVPPEDAYALHVGLIKHGRHVCAARRPRCDACLLRRRCPSAENAGAVAAPSRP